MPRPMRWCQVFPGQEDQIPHVRMFVTQLLDCHPDREDIVACAAELATNAIRHTASGRNGFFATEVTWTGRTVRVAVADSGAETVPGLDRLAGLSSSCGSDGDDRGRVVWAQFLPSTDTAPVATSVPLAAEQSTVADAADLAERYSGWHTWFGHWTRQWWAFPKQASATAALIAEPTAGALARRLDALNNGITALG